MPSPQLKAVPQLLKRDASRIQATRPDRQRQVSRSPRPSV